MREGPGPCAARRFCPRSAAGATGRRLFRCPVRTSRSTALGKRQLIDTLPARERRVECGRHGRFGEHDGC